MRLPQPLPPVLPSAAFTVRDARAAGVSPERLRRTDLTRLYHGTRSRIPDPSSPSFDERVAAYAAIMPEHHHLSHLTAAALNGLRMPETRAWEKSLHVTATSGRAPQTKGVTGHRTDRAVIVHEVGAGIRFSGAIDAWLESAAVLALDDVIRMGDGLLRRTRPLATLSELVDAVAAYDRRPGAGRLVRALVEMRAGTDSAREATLRLLITRAGLPEPEVNGEIRNSLGAVIARGDLVFRAQLLVMEYDGRHHDEDASQYAIDVGRLDDIMEERWRVIRVDKHLLARPAVLLGKVTRALHRNDAGHV